MTGAAFATLRKHNPAIVAIGASAGAIETLGEILPLLAPGFPAPVVVVVHLPASHESTLAQLFGRLSRLPAIEAEDKVLAEPGTIYFAPPDYHLLVERDRTLSLSADPPVQMSRPSIDVLFESVAHGFHGRALGILLTGASADGAEGLASIRQMGGATWVQAPSTARIPVMPEAALALAPHPTLTASEMGRVLSEWGLAWTARL